jgi:hypothetical protein
MTRRSPRWAPVAGLLLIVATNAAVLAGVAWNRSGEPDATLALTQRELDLPIYQIAEDTGLSLSLFLGGDLAWQEDPASWLDRRTLAELGFDVHVAPDAPHADEYYARALPREVFTALEYDGDAWGAWLKRQEARLAEAEAKVASGEMAAKRLEELREELEKESQGHSRLFVVDAARDASTLRRRHPERSRVAVVPAVVRLVYQERTDDHPARLTGFVEPLVTTIHVPLALRPVLDGVAADIRVEQEASETPGVYRPHRPAPPRYEATLAFGRRHEPWLTAVRALPAPE